MVEEERGKKRGKKYRLEERGHFLDWACEITHAHAHKVRNDI